MKKKMIVECDGELYINMTVCGIPPLIICTDGMHWHSWEGDRAKYLHINDVINWYEKEMQYAENETYTEFLTGFKRMRDQYQALATHEN